MYQLAIEKIKQSIFPIFFNIVDGNQVNTGVSGTGFFIDSEGHFLTALHVITEIPANSTLQYRGNIPNHIINPAKGITEVYRDPIRDIFLGKIDDMPSTPVALVLDKPKAGKLVCLCGYPLAQLSYVNGALNVRAVRQYWQPTYIIDEITVANPGQNYVGFITQDISLNGMSGGPVFDMEGIVHGVDTAYIHREITQQGKPSLQVYNGVAIENASLVDVYAMIHKNP